MRYRYRLQRKEPYSMPNILGDRSFPVPTYRWIDIAASNNIEVLKTNFKDELSTKDYRIEEAGERI